MRRHLPHGKRHDLAPVPDPALYDAALRAGCTVAEARFLAFYRHSQGYTDAAAKLGLAVQTLKNRSTTLRHRFGEPHLAGVYVRILTV